MRSRRIAFVLALSVVVLLLAAIPSQATFAKVFSFSVTTPSPVVAGATPQFSAKITNKSLYVIGSAEITVPFTPFTVAPDPKVSVSGNKILIKNMNLILTKTYTVKVTGTIPCTTASLPWSARASSASTFPSPPTNPDFTGSPGSAMTTVTNPATSLAWTKQPADAGVNQTITSVDLDPTGAAIEVAATGPFGCPAALPGPVSLTADPGAVTPSGSYPSPSLGEAGTYTLTATSGGLSAESVSFVIAGEVVECGGTVSGVGWSFEAASGPDCPGTMAFNVAKGDDEIQITTVGPKESLFGIINVTLTVTGSQQRPVEVEWTGRAYHAAVGCDFEGTTPVLPPGGEELMCLIFDHSDATNGGYTSQISVLAGVDAGIKKR